MKFSNRSIVLTAAFVTAFALIVWQATGGDWYTKYEVVKQIEVEPDPNDPLTMAGFYEGSKQTKTVTKDEFRFGFLPTPNGLFDKHSLSVASVTAPAWFFGYGLFWFQKRKNRNSPGNRQID